MSSADRRNTKGLSTYWLHNILRQYGLALIAVAAALTLREGLIHFFGFPDSFVVFDPAILIVALLAGFGPGLFATLLSVGIAAYYLEPANSFKVSHAGDVAALVLFGVVGVAISGMGERFRHRTRRLQEFEKAIEGVGEMIVVVDRDYRYVIANRAFLNYRGMEKEELIGRRISEVLNVGVFEKTLKNRLDECFQGQIVQFEMQYMYALLGERDLFVSYFPVEGANGVNRVACVLQDVTDAKKADRSLKLFRTLIDQSSDAVEVVDPKTLRFLDVNDKACKDLGYQREELLSMKVSDIDLAVDEACRITVIEKLLNSGFMVKEAIHRRKDGSCFPVETSLKYVSLDRDYLVAVSRDISDRKRAEAALRESEDRYRDLVEHSEDLVCTHDLEGRLLSVNPTPARILGYEVGELIETLMRDLVAPECREGFDRYLEKIKSTGADQGTLCVVGRNGERRIWEHSNTLRTDGVSSPIVRGMARDITERKRAEDALRRREEDYRRFVAQSSEGIFREEMDAPVPIDLPEDEMIHHILHDTYMAECNDAMARMYGFTTGEELVGKRLTEMLVPSDPRNIELTREFILSGFRVMERESHEVDIHGRPKVFRNSMIGIVEDGCLVRTWGIQRDVTEQVKLEEARSRAETALQQSENHFRFLVEQASDGIFIADEQGKYTDVNSAGVEMLGYTREEILKLSLTDILASEEAARLPLEVGRFAGGATVLSEWKFRRKDGSFFPGEVCGKRLPDGRLQGILRDISERRRAEEAMRQSEERFRVALKDSPITVFSQDRELRYTWIYNPQLYWQHGCIGKTDAEIIGPKKAANLMDLKRRVLKKGMALREEVLIADDGKSYPLDITIEPLFDEDGRVIGITGAAMDVARLREIADRLQDAKDRLVREKSYLESEIQTELGFEEIIGQSSSLREVLKNVRVVAPTDSTVLLLGETGTGKELVARSLHSLSTRRDKTFIKLNCAAVPSGLLESELFGHEKGAFTSAVSQKAGRIELADKGTLFLDEIGELPLELQPKLLRVLQDREFERLGGVHTLHVDVRIIAATNRDLRQDIADKKFREDLYYRLNVFPIELPSLRERRSDIPILIHHFVRKHAVKMGKLVDIIPDETMTVLQGWHWPGNIRELENMIERMVILSKGRVLAAPPVELGVQQEVTEDNLREMKREHLIRVLRETGGILSGTDGAASRLGIKRTTLQSMLKRHGIELQNFRRRNGMFGQR